MDPSVFNPQAQNNRLTAKITAGLERIAEAYKALRWRYAKELGLSPIQMQVLIFLEYHADELCNVSALAVEFNVTKPTISDAIRVLEQKGLIRKIRSSVDKRAYTVSLTTEGKAMVAAIENFAEPVEQMVATLGSEDQGQLYSALMTVIKGLHRSEVLSVQRSCFACRFYDKSPTGAYCRLMELPLPEQDIRLDCPEFEGKLDE